MKEMTLIDYLDITVALISGALLAVFFFSGLWWTVRQLTSSHQPALLFMFSMLFRTSLVVVGFYFILGDSWFRLLAGLVGFVIVRTLATHFIKTLTQSQSRSQSQSQSIDQKTDYAP